MDDGMKHLRVRFSDVGQQNQGDIQTRTGPRQQGTIFGRGQIRNGDESDASYAATVAAVAYAIAAREEKLASQRKPTPEKLPSRKKPVASNEPTATLSPKSPFRRDESMKKVNEGSKISRWLSGKEPVEEDDEQRANVSVRRPLKPTQTKPGGIEEAKTPKRGESMKKPLEGSKISKWFIGKESVEEDDDEQRADVSVRRPLKPTQTKPEAVTPGRQKVVEPAPGIKKDPSFRRKSLEKKGSRRFEQEQEIQMVAPEVRPTASFPRVRKGSKKFEQEPENQRVPPTARPIGTPVYGEAEAMADAWEKERLAKIKRQYNATMETIAEWEAEKKAKARRLKEPREGDTEAKLAKALQQYNEEMRRISKVAASSRLTAEEKKHKAESKVREKAARIRATGKLPRSCGCF